MSPPRVRTSQVRSTRSTLRPGRKHVRAVLPSGRVCAFVVPNVGEHMEMLDEAISAAQRRCTEGDPTEYQYSAEMRRRAVRRLLVGLTMTPVPPVYLPGMSQPSLRATAEATLREDLAKDLDPDVPADAAAIDAAVAERLPNVLAKLLIAAEDINAMAAAANLADVGDLQWQEGEGVGAYLAAMPNADLGSPEAADWSALHSTVEAVLQPRGAATGPKAQPPVRPLRICTDT